MNVSNNEPRDETLLNKLLIIWEASVRATHKFLQENDIIRLRPSVREELQNIEKLFVVKDKDQEMIGFMGIENNELGMLFVVPHKIGCGVGKKLLLLAIKKYQVTKLAVNEQNPRAKSFYEYFGFTVYQRQEYDSYANHFPILYMELKK